MTDLSKKLKEINNANKKSGINSGVSEPDVFLSTGNYALDFNITGQFGKGFPNRRSTLIWGESGTGKSMLVSQAAARAQEQGYAVVYIDTENALHEDYASKIGLSMDEGKLLLFHAATVSDVTKIFANCFKIFSPEDKVCYVVDSLSNLETDSSFDNQSKGVVKGDQGQLAKQLKSMIKNVNNKIGARDNFLLMSGHAYQNQNVLNGEGLWLFSGGKGVVYLPSVSILLTKLKLKDDNKDITGIRLRTEVTKSRFGQVGRKLELEVPYSTGIDLYDGLFEISLDAGLIENPSMGWYSYELEGKVTKFRKKDFVSGGHVLKLFDFADDGDVTETLDEYDLANSASIEA